MNRISKLLALVVMGGTAAAGGAYLMFQQASPPEIESADVGDEDADSMTGPDTEMEGEAGDSRSGANEQTMMFPLDKTTGTGESPSKEQWSRALDYVKQHSQVPLLPAKDVPVKGTTFGDVMVAAGPDYYSVTIQCRDDSAGTAAILCEPISLLATKTESGEEQDFAKKLESLRSGGRTLPVQALEEGDESEIEEVCEERIFETTQGIDGYTTMCCSGNVCGYVDAFLHRGYRFEASHKDGFMAWGLKRKN